MTAEQKAKELIAKFRAKAYEGVITPANLDLKREALREKRGAELASIAVDEILEGDHLIRTPLSFWEKVKQYLQQISEMPQN